MSKKPTLCRVCGKPIYDARKGQKYHPGGCRDTATALLKMKSSMMNFVSKVNGLLGID